MTSRTDSRGCNLASRADLQTIRHITNATTPTVRTRLTTRMCRPKRKLSGKTRKLKESQSIRSIGLATCTNSHLRTTHVREYVHKPRYLTGARACLGRLGGHFADSGLWRDSQDRGHAADGGQAAAYCTSSTTAVLKKLLKRVRKSSSMLRQGKPLWGPCGKYVYTYVRTYLRTPYPPQALMKNKVRNTRTNKGLQT